MSDKKHMVRCPFKSDNSSMARQKSHYIYCMVLKEQFEMCFLAKIYMLDQS